MGSASNNNDLVESVLVGGPSDLPRVVRVERGRTAGGRLKIERLDGYQRFACQVEGSGPFTWTGRTRFAE